MVTLNLSRAQQSLSPGNKVELFKLDLSAINPSAEPLYFSPSALGSAEIVYNGITYTSVPIKVAGFEMSGQGTLPQPTIQMANVTNIAGSLAAEYSDLIGAILTRLVTFEQFLDGGATPDTSATFPSSVWQVIQKTKQNKLYIEWKCASLLDQNGQQIPKRMVWKSYCLWPYRYWDPTLDGGAGAFNYTNVQGCSYTGTSYFDANDNTTSDETLDVCSKRVSGCKARFGAQGVLPFGGFIGTQVSQ